MQVNTSMEIDKQGTDSEQMQMEVNTPHQSTENHATGEVARVDYAFFS